VPYANLASKSYDPQESLHEPTDLKGNVATPLYGKFGLPEADPISASIKGQVPAGRFGNPSEIAKAVVFLASDEATFTVSGELLIDGGMSL
jgi:NAD(P)-dependent dehydrogenase (short-subunit alcohol dehydrogenase family)